MAVLCKWWWRAFQEKEEYADLCLLLYIQMTSMIRKS